MSLIFIFSTISTDHAQALDTIGCAEPLVELGIKGKAMYLSNRFNSLLGVGFSSLSSYTRYPFVLLLPQSTTEQVLESKLEAMGIQILKPEKAVSLKCNSEGDLELSFESGNVITAHYVLGADGATSVVRFISALSDVVLTRLWV